MTLTGLLGAEVPVVQAGMGGVAGPRLAAAVAAAGAAGQIGLYRLTGREVCKALDAVAELTSRPIGVSLVPEVLTDEQLDEQVTALANRAGLVRFVTIFGPPGQYPVATLHGSGIAVLAQVGDSNEALDALSADIDALVVQGTEAGGHHRGTLQAEPTLHEVHALDVDIPLLVAGGLPAVGALGVAKRMGADGILVGTPFVVAREADSHPLYKASVCAATSSDTRVGRFFELGWPGRQHRVLDSPVTRGEVPADGRFIARRGQGGGSQLLPRGGVAVPTTDTIGEIAQLAMYCGRGVDSVNCVASSADIVRRLVTDP